MFFEFQLEFTPLEFETWMGKEYNENLQKLEFTPLEFETAVDKKEIAAKDFQTDAGRIKFSNDAVQKIELKMISRLCEPLTVGGRVLTWRQVIHREANKLKKCICEDAPYEGFGLE